MFKRGISGEFEEALLKNKVWQKIAEDTDLFFAVRAEYLNVYYNGCSLFKISHDNSNLIIKTHYKYLINPRMKYPYILWEGEKNSIGKRASEIFIDRVDLDLLKKASSYYAGEEKKGVHCILKSNNNIVDVEVALSRSAEEEQDAEDEANAFKRVSDRIDFVALQGAGGAAHIVCFEAKRFDNPELRSAKGTSPPVLDQIKRYQDLIAAEIGNMEESYRRVCKNLYRLLPERCNDLVVAVAADSIDLAISPEVRLVVFGYDTDQRDGKVWKEHKEKLANELRENLLSKGNPVGFTNGIGKYKQAETV